MPWNNICSVNANLPVLKIEAERELAQLNSYSKPAQAWISSVAILGKSELWKACGRTANCHQISQFIGWGSLCHLNLPQIDRQLPDSSLCLIWHCACGTKISPWLKGLNFFCKYQLRLELCPPLQWGQVWALGHWAVWEWTGWPKSNVLRPSYAEGWRPKAFKHRGVSLLDYRYLAIIYSEFRALISKEYATQRIFLGWGNLLDFLV